MNTKKHFAMMWVLWLATACSNNNNTNEMWSNYDYRYTPASGATAYDYNDQSRDNDDNYVAPTGFGCSFDTGQVCE
jgi:hypothetical protein